MLNVKKKHTHIQKQRLSVRQIASLNDSLKFETQGKSFKQLKILVF